MKKQKRIAVALIGLFVIIFAIFGSIALIVGEVRGGYEYENHIKSNWNLADKASTIPQKRIYIDRFVVALESAHLSGKHNAIIFPTPDNDFDKNLEALKSLQLRLREIETMNPASFEYQTAIQQITAQEQGEASAMLDVFEGVWWLKTRPWLWDWDRHVDRDWQFGDVRRWMPLSYYGLKTRY